MKKLLVVTALGFALAGCESFNNASWNPFGSSSAGRSAEQRAQQCANQGLRPGTEKFRLCLERAAGEEVSAAPVPKNKPIKTATAKSEAGSESWTDSVMNTVGGWFK